MQQLDLFGNPIDTKPPQKKKAEEKTIVTEAKQEFLPVPPIQPVEVKVEPLLTVRIESKVDIQVVETDTAVEETKTLQWEGEQEALTLNEPVVEERYESGEEIKTSINIERVVFKKEKKAFKVPIGTNEEKFSKEKKEKTIKTPQKRGRKSLVEINAEVDLIEIPEDEVLFQKQYYSISTVAEWFRVNTSLIRFWENEFDVLKPKKNRKGDRLFRPEDVKNLQLIYHLLRQKKYTVEGAKDYLKSHKKKADTQLQLTQSLQKIKSFLLDLKANLQP